MTTGQKIEAQLDELGELREDFIDNLEAKGVTGLTGDEKFDELVLEYNNNQKRCVGILTPLSNL